MFRGTTPRLIFTLQTQLDFNTIVELWLTFKNTDGKTFTLYKDDVELDNEEKKIMVTLTQKNTLAVSGPCKVQIRVLTASGMAYATSKVNVNFDEILKGGVIGG